MMMALSQMKGIDSFDTLALRLGIELCHDCEAFPPQQHRLGVADPSRGRIHLTQRRVTRRTLRHFLKLMAAIVYSHNRGQPVWQQLYEQNQFAEKTSLKLGIRIPSAWADLDRARAHDALTRSYQEPDKELSKWMRKRFRGKEG
jgi:hypothetical protein